MSGKRAPLFAEDAHLDTNVFVRKTPVLLVCFRYLLFLLFFFYFFFSFPCNETSPLDLCNRPRNNARVTGSCMSSRQIRETLVVFFLFFSSVNETECMPTPNAHACAHLPSSCVLQESTSGDFGLYFANWASVSVERLPAIGLLFFFFQILTGTTVAPPHPFINVAFPQNTSWFVDQWEGRDS